MIKAPSAAGLPPIVVPDPRTVTSRSLVDGHIVTFEALTPEQARSLPPNVVRISVDDGPARWYAIGRRVNARVTFNGQVLRGVLVAFDPNQGNGNYPGVASVSVAGGGGGNLVVTGPTANPVLDLNAGITLTGATAITLSSTAGPTISGGGSGGTSAGLTFFTSGTPGGDAYVFSINAAPSGNLVSFKNTTATVTSIDSSGDVVALGSVTADNAMVADVAADGGTPLTVNGHSPTQTGALLTVNQSAGGVQAAKIDQNGNISFGGVSGASNAEAALQVTGALTQFVPPSSTQQWGWRNALNNTTLGQVVDSGGIEAVPPHLASATAGETFVVSFYSSSAGATSTSPRMFHFSLSTTASCGSLAICTLGTSSVTLGGDLAGTGGYNCVLTDTSTSNSAPRLIWSYSNSVSTLSLTARNMGANTLSGGAVAVNGLCWHD